MAGALLTLLVAFSAPAFPLTQESPEQEQAKEETASAVEQILQQQEQLLRGQQFSYDPGDRRDPFRSLFEKVALEGEKRPPGIAGMLISEIDLDGIVQDGSGGDIAFFTGSDSKGYFLRVGERVYDGTVIGIDPSEGTVTFRQKVDDPRQIKPFRDVVRRLTPTDEESADE
jgi:hypothetical protein